ncbi:protein FAM210A-like [Argonauta hians]
MMSSSRIALGFNVINIINKTKHLSGAKNVWLLCTRCNNNLTTTNYHSILERYTYLSWSTLKVTQGVVPSNRQFSLSSNHHQPIRGRYYLGQGNINLTVSQLVAPSVYCRGFRTNSFQKTSRNQRQDDDDDNGEKEPPKPKSIIQRFKQAYKEHGKVLIGVHLATSAVWFGSFYYLTLSGFDIIPVLEKLNVSESIISKFKSSSVGNIAISYLLYKIATPARYTVTLAGTNLAIRYLKKTGRMKPVPDEAKFKALYSDSKLYLNARRKQIKKNRIHRMKRRLLKLKKLRKKRH